MDFASIIPSIIFASAASSAFSDIRQAQTASDQSEAAAAVARSVGNFNAAVATQNAAIVQQQAKLSSDQAAREEYLRLGTIRASQGHNRGTADSGSALDVLADVAAQGVLERQNIIYQGQLQARGFQNTAALETFAGEAGYMRNQAQADAQTQAGYMKAGTELLAGGANAYMAGTKLSRF